MGAILALLLAMLGSLAPAAGAAAGSAAIRLAPAVGPPTTRTVVKGTGFGPSETVDISFDSHSEGSAETDPQGRFWAPIEIPANALPGAYSVQATGESSGLKATATFTVRTDWPMLGFSLQRTGSNPYENVLSPKNVGNLALAWERTFDKTVDAAPTVSGGVIYCSAGGRVFALRASSGNILWSRIIDDISSATTALTVAHHRVYFANLDGHVVALNARTGAGVWEHWEGGPVISSPLVAGGLMYLGWGEGLDAFDAVTGERLWYVPTVNHRPVYGAPSISQGVVYFGSDDGLYAVDAVTGTLLWRGPPDGEVDGSPAVSGGLVYVGSEDHNLYAFSASGCGQATCSPVWSAPTADKIATSPAVAGGLVYISSHDGVIHAFDAATGAPVWSFPTGAQVTPSAVVANHVLYAPASPLLYALDAATGEQLWSYTTGGNINSPPTVVDGSVYLGSFDFNLYAFRLPG